MRKNSYYDKLGVSQSYLKKFTGANPQVYTLTEDEDLWYTEKKHFTIGDGVDMQLTTPKLFDELMFTSQLDASEKPTDKMLGVIHLAYDKAKEVASEFSTGVFETYALEAARELGWNPKWGDEAILKNVRKYSNYFADLYAAEGKTVLTLQDKEKIDSLVIAIRTHENTSKYFTPQSNAQQIVTQVAIYWERDMVECKALLDLVVIDHTNKTIQPIDIKTTLETISMFKKAVRRNRYDIQAAWYTYALQEWVKSNEDYHGYAILPFKFIAISTTDQVPVPIVFTCSEDLLRMGKYGRPKITTKKDGIQITLASEVKGYERLWQDMLAYEDLGFVVSLDVLEGDVTLDWD